MTFSFDKGNVSYSSFMQFRESNCISILLIHFENQSTVHKSLLPIMMDRIAFVTVCCDKTNGIMTKLSQQRQKWSH